MNNKNHLFLIYFFGFILLGLILLGGAYFIPWQKINWGKLQLVTPQTVTVNGTVKTQEKNQIARFSAGVSSVNDNKEEAIKEVNQKTEALIETVKNFGIESKDIQTQNLNIYLEEERYWEEGREKSRPGQWRVSNSVEIILRDVDRSSSLADALAKSGATNVYGPNFSLDETQEAEERLLEKAIKNARQKAETIAQSSGRKLGKIISVVEGGSSQTGVFRLEGVGGGGGVPIEPGTGTVSKTVTVTFGLE